MSVVVMGVSASGKSSLAEAIARALGWLFLEGDDLHSPANHAKMAAGIPLDDADRAPWLDAVAAWLAAHPNGVASCSALRRAYRDRLRATAPDVRFVYLDVARGELERRLAARTGHFMPPSLLASQLATLEPPGADEDAVRVDGALPLPEACAAAIQWLDQNQVRTPNTAAAPPTRSPSARANRAVSPSLRSHDTPT